MDYSILQNSPLFKLFNAGEIDNIMHDLPHQIKSYREGAMITLTGETVTSLMLVIKGIVKGEMVDFTGKVIKIEDIPAPGALAAAFIFGSKNRYPVNVISVTYSELLIISKYDFQELLKKNDRILVNFLDMISNRSQFLSEKIKFLNLKTIKGKLAQLILQRAGEDKKIIVMEMTHNEIADYFGVARPSVSRALGELEEEELIEVNAKVIRILDKDNIRVYLNS